VLIHSDCEDAAGAVVRKKRANIDPGKEQVSIGTIGGQGPESEGTTQKLSVQARMWQTEPEAAQRVAARVSILWPGEIHHKSRDQKDIDISRHGDENTSPCEIVRNIFCDTNSVEWTWWAPTPVSVLQSLCT